MSSIIQLNRFRQIHENKNQEVEYRQTIEKMSKVELLNEMVRFQEERSTLGELTPELMIKGRILFTALEQMAETRELQILTRSYSRHLEHELKHFLSKS